MEQAARIRVALILAAMTLAGWTIVNYPPFYQRLSWKMDIAVTYLRGVLHPVQPLPTALPLPHVAVTRQVALLSTDVPAVSPTDGPTPTPTPSPTSLPSTVSLPASAWEKQDINNCGPASLTMYLRFYGWKGDQFEIAKVVKPVREDRNVNVDELAYFVRTQVGWLDVEYRVGGNLELLKSLIASGIPVMIEESFYFKESYWPNDDLWGAHYLLLTGYDDQAQTFTGQDSFYGSDQKEPYEKLEQYWQAFNRVYLMVFSPGQVETVKTILGEDWDPDINRQNALKTAQTETQTDPKNAYTWFNLGTNLVYFERYVEATQAYDQARKLGLPQRMLRYQFGPFLAYFHSGQLDDLLALTKYALERTPTSEEAWLWQGWAMVRKGDTAQAIDDFRKALVHNPNYRDAQYALDFVHANP